MSRAAERDGLHCPHTFVSLTRIDNVWLLCKVRRLYSMCCTIVSHTLTQINDLWGPWAMVLAASCPCLPGDPHSDPETQPRS
eukprot:3388736-Amphidinium_carterae.1